MDMPTPSRTLYVRNLPDKLPKQRLRRLLHAAFSSHGRVVWIVAEKTKRLRGQAFITFEHQTGATSALRALQSSDFMGKPMSIAYAKQVTDRAQSKSYGGESTLSRKKRALHRQKQQQQQNEQPNENDDILQTEGQQQQQQQQQHIIMPPNNILFLQNLPQSSTNENNDVVPTPDVLKTLFARFSGFVEVRSVPGKTDIAFVEFESDGEAGIAMSGLDQHELGTPPQRISVNFAKK